MRYHVQLRAVLLIAVAAPASAQSIVQITDTRVESQIEMAIDDAGDTVVAISSVNDSGNNPSNAFQISAWDRSTGAWTPLTTLSRGAGGASGSGRPKFAFEGNRMIGWGTSLSISDDGQTIAFVSSDDPLGQNDDNGRELFLLSVNGGPLVQLTDLPGDVLWGVGSATLSGSGNRVAFVSRTDILGTNPALAEQLFVIDTDGSGLVQLTTAPAGRSFRGISISDDGTRLVFAHDGNLTGFNPGGDRHLFRVASDGSALVQITLPGTDNEFPQLSGNGSRVVYRAGSSLRSKPYLGGQPSVLDSIASGGTLRYSITDDGATVFYSGIYKIPATGGTRVSLVPEDFTNLNPVVSGDGTRLVYDRFTDSYDVPDDGQELYVVDADGSGQQKITDNQGGWIRWAPDLSADGSRMVFLGLPGYEDDIAGSHVYTLGADGNDLVKITPDLTVLDFNSAPQITADGETVVFTSTQNYTGENPSSQGQIFRAGSDGSALTQLTQFVGSGTYVDHPDIADDVGIVVFEGFGSFDPLPGNGLNLYAMPLAGGAITRILSDGLPGESPYLKYPRVDAAGRWVTYESWSNFDGMNPNELPQVFRARIDGSVIERLTAAADHGSYCPDISADGNRIVFVSFANLTGANPAHESRLFLFEATTNSITPLAEGGCPRISRDGAFVSFKSERLAFEFATDAHEVIYRLGIDSGLLERVSGFQDLRDDLQMDERAPQFAVDANGGAVFAGRIDASLDNPDFSNELWRVDFGAAPRIDVGRDLPTTLSWDPDPRYVRYDVIRGDVASLSSGPGGTTVDLGAVTCLGDDSSLPGTAPPGDARQPATGQALFYLYRGTQGALDGPGSWGDGTIGERFTSGGSCSP